jgi:hypothetical protein
MGFKGIGWFIRVMLVGSHFFVPSRWGIHMVDYSPRQIHICGSLQTRKKLHPTDSLVRKCLAKRFFRVSQG